MLLAELELATLPTEDEPKRPGFYPELFFDVRYIVAACIPCSRHGAEVASQNRVNRMTVANLERENEQLRAEYEQLLAQLAALANGEPAAARRPLSPRIY